MESNSGATQNNADRQTSMGKAFKRVPSVNDGRDIVKESHLIEQMMNKTNNDGHNLARIVTTVRWNPILARPRTMLIGKRAWGKHPRGSRASMMSGTLSKYSIVWNMLNMFKIYDHNCESCRPHNFFHRIIPDMALAQIDSASQTVALSNSTAKSNLGILV